MRSTVKYALTLVILSSLAACGGSGGSTGSGDSGAKKPPSQFENFTSALAISHLDSIPCADFKLDSASFTPPDFVKQCWTLTVPEDYVNPKNGKTIKLAIAKANSANNNKKGAIAFLQGGPGGSVITDLWFYGESPIRDENDIYFVDQRGTGYSSPALYCEFESSNDETNITVCKSKFENRGIDLNQFNSKNNALDFIVLRKKLEDTGELKDKWTLVGASYGTRLAITVLREEDRLTKQGFQTESGIKAMVLDGVFPIQVNGINDAKWANYENFKRIIEVCNRSLSVCDSDTLKSQIQNQLIDLPKEDHQYYLSLLLSFMPYDTTHEDWSEYTIPAFSRLPISKVKELLQEHKEEVNAVPDIPDDFYATGLSVVCAEEYGFPPYYEQMNTERANWTSEVQQVIDNSFHMEFTPTACKIWDVKKSADEEALGVKNDTVPVLITQGGNDYQTPQAWGNLVKKDFANSRVITDDTIDHVVLFSENGDCIQQNIKTFVGDPSKLNDLDVTCVNNKKFIYKD
ncbi:Hydrolase, alpha/beta hydrolase fold family [Moritella sp. JT01]|uniref:alpha/beta hydrolase n=1 Tax=Moritella sp. JT01 TaxID=756698 RepID=UPI000797382E|nr:alpha/beta hydrolase [Moritella sp. JT01]KXO08004.1 Hydrolase, alpha/beta hydrolase fold family [Moritella sp. JT01]